MKRTYLKEHTAIGPIKKIMEKTATGINLYTETRSGICHDGCIDLDMENTQSQDWIDRGFIEIK